MPACVGGDESGAFSRDDLGLQRPNASRAPSRAEQIPPSLATCLPVLPYGAVMVIGRKERAREVRKMLKDNLEGQASQKVVEKNSPRYIQTENFCPRFVLHMHVCYIHGHKVSLEFTLSSIFMA